MAFICITYILFIIFALIWWKSILCEYNEAKDEHLSVAKNAFIGFIFLIEITPCLLIIYVFYYIPILKGVVDKKNGSHLIQDIKIEDNTVSL